MIKIYMKKLIFLIVILITTTLNASTQKKLSVLENSDYESIIGIADFVDVVVPFYVNLSEGKFIIYTSMPQEFNIVSFNIINYNGCKVIECCVKHSYYINYHLNLYMFKSGNWYIRYEHNIVDYKLK